MNYSFASQTAAGITSSVQSGLTAGLTYYWKVYAVSEGGLSSALSGNQTTTTLVLTNWLHHKSITVDYTKVGTGPHTNFPLLISITDVDLKNKAQADGDDILFTSIDGAKLDHQIESYTSATGTLVAWVKIPSLSSAVNTTIEMYYGNASATAQQNVTGTWDANFKGIWHLNGAFTDATSNANNGTNTGTISATGKISGGRGFVRSDGADYITVPGKMGSPTSFTLSAWTNLTTTDVNAADIISIADNNVLRYDVSNGKTAGVSYDGTTWNTTLSSSNYASGWHYVVYTFDDVGNIQRIYVDGQPNGSATNFTTSPNYTGGTNTFFGTHGNGNTNMDFDGTMDEVRISNVSRSAGWILTEYNNQNNPSTFYSIGSEACQTIISQIPSSNLILNYKFNGNANDETDNDNGTLQNAPTTTSDRFGNAVSAYSFNGTNQYISTAKAFSNPSSYSTSIWFKTTTTVGGVLIGFSSMQTGVNGNRDRFIYMTGTGTLYIGVAPNAVKKYVSTTTAYNDGNWHLATSTLGAGGLKLYVDGLLVGSDGTVTSAENYSGYWRIGHDDIASWPNEPTSHYFQGTLDDAVIYHRELNAAEVSILYNSPDGAGSNGPVCVGTTLNLTATTVSGGIYAWTGPNGFTSSLQNPTLTYGTAYAGIYMVEVTTASCSTPSRAYVKVTSSLSTGQWMGSVSTDWANAANWCDGVVPSSTTDVVILATASNMPTISSSVSCKNLTINLGATVTLGSAGTLNIAGTLTNNGTFTNSGTVNFNGTSGQQTFSGVSSFYNLTLSNATGLLLPAAITVNNNLTISAGTLNANNFNIAVKGGWTNNASTTALTAGTATVTFNGTTAQTIAGTFATTFNNLTIANTGNSVTLSVNTNVTGNLSVSSGTFDLGAFTANRVSSGGVLTVSNNATLKIGGTNTYPTNYITNTLIVASTVEYSGTNQNIANQSYGNLKLSSASGAAVKTLPATALTVLGNLSSVLGSGTSVSFTAASAITVGGNVAIGASTTFNGSSYLFSTGGNWVNDGTFNGNTSTVTFTGSGTTVSGSGIQNFNNLTIAASLVNFVSNNISLTGNLATTGSGSFTQVSGGTLLMTGTSATISGSGISVDNLTVSGSVSTTTSFTLMGNLSVSGSFIASNGVITMTGSTKTISGVGTIGFSTLSVPGAISSTANFSISLGLSVNGSLSATAGTATFTGTSTLSGTANLYNITVNGTSLLLSAGSTLGVANLLSITSGTLDVTSSAPNTVNFNGTGAQGINAITYSNLMLSNGNTKTASGAFTINNNLTIATSTNFIPGGYTHSIYGSWTNSGNFTAGTSTIQFLANQNSSITGSTTFNVLTINKATSATSVTIQSNITAATVNMTVGTMYTAANTLTITNTRTGNGIILGNINRTHAFTTGVAYAFEGPENTINFTAVSGVTSVTVSVVKAPVSDFPFGGSISRAYTITVPNGTYTATLRLHYEDDELNGSVESSMALWRYNGTAWVSSGKTANSTTANYVEQSGLTAITNRWTFSDNSNVIQWNGSVSTNWNTAANWTVLQGSASAPPSATDIVNLGTVTFTHQPTISSTVNVKNINFGDVQAVSLSMTSSGSLTSGDIKGIWNNNITHTINANDQSITINGDLSLSDGVTGHAINLNIGAGTVNLMGSLNQLGGANVVFTAAGAMAISKNFNYLNGTFTAGSGTVIYNGTENQEIGHVNYNNLTINKLAGAAFINFVTTIAGNFLVSAGEADISAATTVVGNVTVSTGAILHNTNILHIGGNWNNSGTFNDDGINVIFNGAGTQTISTATFNNLEINKTVGTIAILSGNVTLKGNLAGTSGTLDIQSYFFNRDVVGGTATIANAGTLIIGANNAPTKFSNYALAASSTVIFNGTATQHLQLPGVTYGNLIFRNAGLKILYTAITVNGDLTIETGATFDGGSNTITLNSNWVNTGTFTPSSSTVLWAGTSKNISGNTTFNRVTVTGSYTLLNDIVFNTLLNITSTGSLSGGPTIVTTMNGDLVNSGILYSLGTTIFTGNTVQTLSLINAVQTVALRVSFNGSISPVLNSTSTPQFGYLTINNTGGVNPSLDWTILYSLTIGSGASFNAGAFTHNILGAVTNNGTINSSGVLNLIPSTAVPINLGTNFSSTGTVIFGGTGAITLTATPYNFYNIIVSNTNAAGISASSNWTIANNLTVNSGSILNAGTYTHIVGGHLANSGTINSGTSTFILNGTSTQNISTGSAFNNLTINKASGLSILLSDASVNGVLNFIAGKIQTGNYKLIQSSTGTITGAGQHTGWVNGKLQKYIITGATNKIFEVGDATNYTPVTIAFANVTTAGNLTASTTASDHANIGSSVINPALTANRHWTLTSSNIVFTSYSLTGTFVAGDLDNGTSPTSLIMGQYNNGEWSYPTVGANTTTTIQAISLTSFGDFQPGVMLSLIKTWDGGAGTNNWGDAANWNTNGVPTSIDDVDLTGSHIININVAAVTKNLLLNNATLILTLTTGNSLTVSENFTLSAGTFNTATIFPTVNGTVNVANGTVEFSGSASQTIPVYNYNNLTSSSTGARALANNGIIGIAGTFTPGTNAYTITGSTIDYNAPGKQTVSAFNYNNLTLSNSEIKTFAIGTSGISSTLAITGSASADALTNTATISYNGSTSQTVTPLTYYTLDIASVGSTVSLGANLNIEGDLSVTSGTFDLGSFTANRLTEGGTLTVANAAKLKIGGTNTLPANYTAHSIGATSTIVYEGTSQVIAALNSSQSYGHLEVLGSGATLNADVAVTSNLTISGSLNINTHTLKIGGAISNSGTFTASNGTIEMNGTVAQTIPASTFAANAIKNLTTNNAAGVILQGTLDLTEILLASSGQFNTGGHLTLISSATKTALIDGSGSGSVTGNVTMQRYLAAGYGYKYFSSPFQAATVGNFSATVDLNSTFANFYTYIQDKITSGFTSYTNPSNILTPMHGYAADFGSSTASKLVSITGVVNNGTLSSTLFNHNRPFTQGFNLVGNPYPSPIDWNAASGWTKTNIDNAVYFFNSGTTSQYTGAYSTYINGVSSDGIAGNIIASMQGFFIHVSDGSYPVSGTLGFNNSVRVNDLSPIFHKSTFSSVTKGNNQKPRILLRLSANFSGQELSSDPLVVYTNEFAGPAFDQNLDAIKLMNSNEQLPNLYSIATDLSKLVINSMQDFDSLTVIPLGVQTAKDGLVTFNLRNVEKWPSYLRLYLKDEESGISHDLQQNAKYAINLEKGTYENRFSLQFRATGKPSVITSGTDEYIVFGSNGNLQVRIRLVKEQKGYLVISNMLGQLISRRPINGNGDYPLDGLSPETIYLVSFITPTGTHTKKIHISK
ncbi:DUF2341 domain-containing protein [Pedobacter polaris]|uniref:DUF2341 domain-containing protein n=1 Tax=Pedobacter polaris TaxID=2571273 RepID=UPI00197DBF97|nr:DUF2341 domain-containing protein [Pedobacter polaris]